MITRRAAIRLLGSVSAGAWVDREQLRLSLAHAAGILAANDADSTPALAAGAPTSPERTVLIDAFRKQSEGLQNKFEARTHKSDWEMPYRLFRPEATGKVPLVVYLHGGGGLGNDNLKQLGLGNVFGTRVWLLPENQKRFPCFVVAPQTDRAWARFDFSKPDEPKLLEGLGDGARLALEIIDRLCHEFAGNAGIDERRIYLTGQSMGDPVRGT